MTQLKNGRRALAVGLLGAASLMLPATIVPSIGRAQSPQHSRDQLREPVFRVGRAGEAEQPRQEQPQPHPLDPALRIAYDGLAHIQKNIHDYTAVMVKRERINGELTEQEFMDVKIRNRKVDNGRTVVPFAIYLRFLKPDSMKGREVIYVEGQNNGKLVAHEVPGFRNLIRAPLDPNGFLAMRGNRYPITEAGIETLVTRLIEKGERDRQRGECDVQFYKNAKINGRSCTLLRVLHPEPRAWFDFHIAEIFIDDELNVPVRYAAYSWPKTPGGNPILEEEYTYMNVQVNVGLTEADFDPNNPAYKYP